MRGHIEVDDHAPMMSEYDEAEQDAKRHGRYREEVDCHNIANMIVQESPPRLRRRLAVTDSVFVHGCLRRLVAKEPEFRADSRRSPDRILARHASNQRADLGVDLRAAGLPGSRLPSPVELEALFVPANDGFGLHDDEDGSPIRPESRQPHPENSITVPQLRSFGGHSQATTPIQSNPTAPA